VDLERSRLFHRLRLLAIPWAEPTRAAVRSAGTFHEYWRVQWKPEFAIGIVDASRWGSTLVEAASASAVERATKTEHVDAIAQLLEAALLAALPVAIENILEVLDQRAALSRDAVQLMEALPPLARTRRYGSVREIDAAALDRVLQGLAARICIGLPSATASLDDEAAAAMIARLGAVDTALQLLENEEHVAAWRTALEKLIEAPGLHSLIAGRIARLLHDARAATPEDTARRMQLALSHASNPLDAAHWVEGFASGSGAMLLHDGSLWSLVDGWLAGLSAEHFVESLPLLRRTFASFPHAERRAMGERVRRGASLEADTGHGVSAERAAHVLPVLRQIFGKESA
jgi:hypothetical protein